MKKFDMSSAWDDAVQLARLDLALTAPVIGMLVVLPTLAFATLGPVPIEPPAGADLAALGEIVRADLAQSAPMLVLISFLSAIASLVVMRLWLAPRGTSVSEALGMAVGLVPAMAALFVIQLLAMGIAALALLVPALYLGGRLATSFAVLATGDTRSPLAALEQSWAMTRGNGWRIAIMLFLIQLVIVIAAMLVDGVGAAFGARGTIGHALASLISAGLGGVSALVASAVNAAVYRQLSPTVTARTFD
jgi:hypothetical protein